MLAAPEQLLAAAADRTRLRILALLRVGPLCVGDLVQLLGVQQPKVSRHLAVLRSRQLVGVRTRDRWRIYSLAPAGDDVLRAVHDLLRAVAVCDPELQRDTERRRALVAAGGCCPNLSLLEPAPDLQRSQR